MTLDTFPLELVQGPTFVHKGKKRTNTLWQKLKPLFIYFDLNDKDIYIADMVLPHLVASEATTASKQLLRSTHTENFKSVSSITYISMCIVPFGGLQGICSLWTASVVKRWNNYISSSILLTLYMVPFGGCFWGHYTASKQPETKSDLRFEISDLNHLCSHVFLVSKQLQKLNFLK